MIYFQVRCTSFGMGRLGERRWEPGCWSADLQHSGLNLGWRVTSLTETVLMQTLHHALVWRLVLPWEYGGNSAELLLHQVGRN